MVTKSVNALISLTLLRSISLPGSCSWFFSNNEIHRELHVLLLVKSSCLVELKMTEQTANKFALYRKYIPPWPKVFLPEGTCWWEQLWQNVDKLPLLSTVIYQVLMRSTILLKLNYPGQLYSSLVGLNYDFETFSCNPPVLIHPLCVHLCMQCEGE